MKVNENVIFDEIYKKVIEHENIKEFEYEECKEIFNTHIDLNINKIEFKINDTINSFSKKIINGNYCFEFDQSKTKDENFEIFLSDIKQIKFITNFNWKNDI